MYFITSSIFKRTSSRLALLAAGTFTAIYVFQNEATTTSDTEIEEPKYDVNVSCYYVLKGDALPSAENLKPPPNSIFFHETSCRGGLNSRQACVVESAARIHPDRNIYVYFNSPVSKYALNKTWLSIFTRFKNVNLARLHVKEYTKGTPLHNIFANRKADESVWPIQHTADMLRFVTLHKYGGLYLDTDLLVVKPLDALGKNWAAKEDDVVVNIAAMAFDTDDTGRNLSRIILNDISRLYRPDLWTHNESGALMRSLLKFCNISSKLHNKSFHFSAVTCHGFKIYNKTIIYPIPWRRSQLYFLKDFELPKWIHHQAQSHHLWNMISQKYEVEINSPFDKLARKYCPTIRQLFGDRFGS